MINSRIILSAVCGAIGIVIGYLCANVSFGDGNSKGDITKVSKFNKSVVSPQAQAFQEKIMNNPEAFSKTKSSLVVLYTRMNDFNNLVCLAKESSAGIDALAPSLAEMENISILAENAKNTAIDAVSSFKAMTDGEKGSAGDYETASKNLSLAFFMIGRQINVGKDFVKAVDSYLEGKSIDDNLSLAAVRDLWAGYCASQAFLDGDSEELEFWASAKQLVTDDVVSALEAVDQTGAALAVLENNDAVLGLAGLGHGGYARQDGADDQFLAGVTEVMTRAGDDDQNMTDSVIQGIDVVGYTEQLQQLFIRVDQLRGQVGGEEKDTDSLFY